MKVIVLNKRIDRTVVMERKIANVLAQLQMTDGQAIIPQRLPHAGRALNSRGGEGAAYCRLTGIKASAALKSADMESMGLLQNLLKIQCFCREMWKVRKPFLAAKSE